MQNALNVRYTVLTNTFAGTYAPVPATSALKIAVSLRTDTWQWI